MREMAAFTNYLSLNAFWVVAYGRFDGVFYFVIIIIIIIIIIININVTLGHVDCSLLVVL